jgi:hypothetical protein
MSPLGVSPPPPVIVPGVTAAAELLCLPSKLPDATILVPSLIFHVIGLEVVLLIKTFTIFEFAIFYSPFLDI